ncbi:MAG: hypothetical protein JWO94_186 [Verrucomicrobiaceae bacterium]|nr:hypothetical protein [Verrucomicrobiaceae bacterium]
MQGLVWDYPLNPGLYVFQPSANKRLIMKTNRPSLLSSRLLPFTAGLLALAALLPRPAAALNDVNQIKLYGHWAGTPAVPANPASYLLGASVALSEKWALAGAYFSSEQASSRGVVQVYNAVTGAWVRKILPPPPVVATTYFGVSMAISGDLAVIGAEGLNNFTGGAYVYNLATGAYIRALSPPGALPSENVGTSIAISGRRVVLSATGYNSNRGAAYVFDLPTGAFLGRIDLGAGGVANEVLGTSMVADGDLLVLGAPGHDSNRGAVFFFNLATLQQVTSVEPVVLAAGNHFGSSMALSRGSLFVGAPYRNGSKGSVFILNRSSPSNYQELTATDSVALDYFGFSIAADAGRLLVGAYGANADTGAAYLYDVSQDVLVGLLVRKISAVDGLPGSVFGYPVALCGSTALVGSEGDGTQAANAGAAYLLRPLVAPLSALTKVVARGESAPGAPDTTFNVMGDPVINGSGVIAFSSTLAGSGSAGGTDTGLWSTLSTSGTLQLVTKTRTVLPGGAVIQSLGPPVFNEISHLMFQGVVKAGTGGSTALSNHWLFNKTSATGITPYGSNGVPAGGAFGTATVASFSELVQSDEILQDKWAVVLNLTHSTITGTTAANDTGVQAQSGSGATVEGYREGVSALPAGGFLYGQFSGRLSYFYQRYLFSAATTGPVTTNQVLVAKTLGTADATIVAQKGDIAPDASTSTAFSSFLGESTDGANGTVYRATLAGGGATVANNEGVWSRTTGGVKRQVLRKGQLVGTTGLKVAKIINVWAGYQGAQEVLALVQLAGTGVTAANDQALLLVQDGSNGFNPNLNLLLREGDAAPGCGGAPTIGVISRVLADAYGGGYMVLATLAGAAPGTEQALFTGFVYRGNNNTQSILRRPSLFLRKGWQFDGQPGKVRSISFNAANMTASGFGSTGRGSALSFNSQAVLTVEFDNGAKQIMSGGLF